MARPFLYGTETSVLLELTGLAERRLSLEEDLRSVFLSLLTLIVFLVSTVRGRGLYYRHFGDITVSVYFQAIVSVFWKITAVSETPQVQFVCMG